MIALGIDSGPATGAVAIVERRTVLACATWGPVQRAKVKRSRVLWWTGDDVRETLADHGKGLHVAIMTMEAMRATAAAVEAVTPQRHGGGASVVQAIRLAESAGEAVGWCRRMGLEPLRPTADVWRKSAGVPMRDASRAAVVARAMVGGPSCPGVPVVVRGLSPDLAAVDHVADAVLIACWRASVTT